MHRGAVVLAVVLAVLIAASPAAISGGRTGGSPWTTGAVPPLLTDVVPLPVDSVPRLVPAATPVEVTLTLSNPNSAALEQFLLNVEDPSAPGYRHFVSYSEYLARFAPPTSSVAIAEATLAGAGGTDLAAAPDRSSVSALVPADGVADLFGARLVTYGFAGSAPLYTSVGTVALPSSLQGLVSGIGGLSDGSSGGFASSLETRNLSPRPVALGSSQFVRDNSTGDWFIGSDYTQAFAANHLFPGSGSVPNATYPTHVAIATLLASAYNLSSQTDLPPWDPTVVAAYFNGTLGPGWPTSSLTGVPVTAANRTPPLPSSFGAENDTSSFEVENSLDLEMAGSLAPGASLYNFYFAGSLLASASPVGDPADYLTDDLSAALAYNYSPAHLAAISCSFGLPDLDVPAWDAELLTAAALGVTVLAASGDQGNAPDSLTQRDDGPWPIWPATDVSNTSGALSVGGISLAMSGSPNAFVSGPYLNLTYDAGAGDISGMSTWYDTSGGQGTYAGSEGGVSTVFPEPYWQLHSAAQPAIVNATVLQGAGALGRAGPDVAMPGNATLVTAFANATGTIFIELLEGTSIASPVLAGLVADVVAVENNNGGSGPWRSLGFIDPEIYRIASYFAQYPATRGDPFLDVTTGANYVFSAAPGWDPTTGWGAVNAPAFLAADQNATLVEYTYTGPTPGLPPGTGVPAASAPVPWAYIFAIFGVGVVVAVALVILTARPSRRPPSSTIVPWGAQGFGHPAPPSSVGGSAPGATFLCPYCGAMRPAEPVRCPQCGAF